MGKKTFSPGIYGNWLMVVRPGAIERGEKLFGEGQEFVEMQGTGENRPTDSEIKKIIESWGKSVIRSKDAKEKLALVKDGCFAIYFSNGDGKTFTGKYICQTNL
jgi:hypothetical protein